MSICLIVFCNDKSMNNAVLTVHVLETIEKKLFRVLKRKVFYNRMNISYFKRIDDVTFNANVKISSLKKKKTAIAILKIVSTVTKHALYIGCIW